MYMIYVDDSGDQDHDLLSAIAIPVEAWSAVLANWKQYRMWLDKAVSVPVRAEFHSEVILKRGSLELEDRFGGTIQMHEPEPGNHVRNTRQVAYVKGLKTINGFQRLAACADRGVRLLTIHAGVANGSGDLYPALIEWLEEWLSRERTWGSVWYDSGDPAKDAELRAVHRNLAIESRRIVEDPTTRRSHESHFLQMADMCAYAALHAIRQDLGQRGHPQLKDAYLQLHDVIEPGGYDADGFPWSADDWKIRGWS